MYNLRSLALVFLDLCRAAFFPQRPGRRLSSCFAGESTP